MPTFCAATSPARPLIDMKKPIRILQLLLLVVLLVSLFMLGRQAWGSRVASQSYDEAARIAGLPERKRSLNSGQQQFTAGQADASQEERVALDLEALQAINSDVVGWIEIPGTELSYPLLQTYNNRYYLNHTWSKEYSPAGSVYLECTSRSDFSGFHTIVYGHRMSDDTMFGSLKYYNTQNYWEQHPSVYVTLPDGVYRYDIFAAFQASATGIVYRLDVDSRKTEFIRTALNSSAINTGIVPETSDQILTLSTCTQFGHANRWVVQGLLAQVYEPDSPELPW